MNVIPWHLVRRGLVRLSDITDDARAISGGDQTSTYYRSRFAELEVDLADPRNAYTALAVLAVTREAVGVAYENEVLSDDEAANTFGIIRGLEFGIADAAPDHARERCARCSRPVGLDPHDIHIPECLGDDLCRCDTRVCPDCCPTCTREAGA